MTKLLMMVIRISVTHGVTLIDEPPDEDGYDDDAAPV
jgi:hypothetical protein